MEIECSFRHAQESRVRSIGGRVELHYLVGRPQSPTHGVVTLHLSHQRLCFQYSSDRFRPVLRLVSPLLGNISKGVECLRVCFILKYIRKNVFKA